MMIRRLLTIVGLSATCLAAGFPLHLHHKKPKCKTLQVCPATAEGKVERPVAAAQNIPLTPATNTVAIPRSYSLKEMYATNATPDAVEARKRYEARKAGALACDGVEMCPEVEKK